MRNKSQKIKRTSSLIAILMLVFSQLFFLVVPASANVLTTGSIAISDSRPTETGVSYTSTWSNVDTTTLIRCVEIEFATTAAGGTIPTSIFMRKNNAKKRDPPELKVIHRGRKHKNATK